MVIDFYYSPLSPPCRTVIMTAKLLDINFNMKRINTMNGETKTPEFLKINPQHSIPTIVDGDLKLWESRAICAYLCNQYVPGSDLYPKDPKKRAVVDRMLNFDVGTFVPSVGKAFVLKFRTGIDATPEQVKDGEEKLKLFDTLIGNNKFVAGDKLTIADLSIVAMVSMLEFQKCDFSPYPNMKKWYERIYKDYPVLDEMKKKEFEELKKFIEMNKKK